MGEVPPEPITLSLPGLCAGRGLCLALLSFLPLQPFLREALPDAL